MKSSKKKEITPPEFQREISRETPVEKTYAGTLLLFSFTLFLSAALMFSLQPMVGKMLLPIVGGTPAGWIVAMAFFQVMLLMGYLLAHLLARFRPRSHALLYMLCLGIGLPFLPTDVAAYAGLVSDTPRALDTFKLLTASVGVSFIALSGTASTLQRLFVTTAHARAADPYFLYAASNIGSLVGLLAYPLAIEPTSTLSSQSAGWLGGYVLLIALTGACIAVSGKRTVVPGEVVTPVSDSSPSWRQRRDWIALAFFPSALLVAVTAHVTTDVLSVPLLWVIPLGIYLLTFILAFSRRSIVQYEWIQKLQPAAVAIVVCLTFLATGFSVASWKSMAAEVAAFGVVALMCHMRLARIRPAENTSHLTDYYLMIALGGSLGGILSAFVAPMIFSSMIEFPLLMTLSCVMNEGLRRKFSPFYRGSFFAGCVFAGLLLLAYRDGLITSASLLPFLLAVSVILTLHPLAALRIGLIALGAVSYARQLDPTVVTRRNFYGVIRVFETHSSEATGTDSPFIRVMQHGTTVHGTQIFNAPELELQPTTYYSYEGPVQDVISFLRPRRIAAIGLGAGSMNCYAAPDRQITFFEINPAVIDLAKSHFNYLSKCGVGMPRIVEGDARLELERMADERFDLIVLDAFSSDMIPLHLLTREAIEMYLQRLTPDGIILFHITNRFFRLDEPITALSETLQLRNAFVDRTSELEPYAAPSRWMLLTRQPDENLIPLGSTGWVKTELVEKRDPWTDDYTSLLNVMNF